MEAHLHPPTLYRQLPTHLSLIVRTIHQGKTFQAKPSAFSKSPSHQCHPQEAGYSYRWYCIPVPNRLPLMGFSHVTALEMINYLFREYREINDIDIKEKAIHMMRMYNPDKPLVQLIEQLEKGQEFARAGGKTIANAMMVSKEINVLTQTMVFNNDMWDWQSQPYDLKT